MKKVYSVMGQLSSKLYKNKNNTDISLYEMYKPKLHDNILKYYRLNLFKEIAIVFNHSLQVTLESPANFSDSLNAAVILVFSSSSVLHGVLFVSC